MNDVPRNDEPPEDIDDLYRRAAALDPSRPSERVRDAVLSHAAQLAAERPSDRTQDTAAPAPSPTPTASSSSAAQRRPWYQASRFVPRRLSTIVGTFAAAVLVGLLVTPRFLLTPNATLNSNSKVQIVPIAPLPAAPPEILPRAEEVQPYISRPPERAAAAARAPATQSSAAPVAAPTPPTAPAPITAPAAAPAPSVAYASATSNAIAQARNLPLTAAPDSPASEAALRRAAERGDIPKLQALFDRGVDVNVPDADDRSALLLAVLNGQTKVVELLLTHGANVNAADRSGTTPLQAALSTHQTAVAATLRAAGAH